MSETVFGFNEIPNNLLVPGTRVEIQEGANNSQLYDWPARVVLIGQMLAAGSGQPLTVYSNMTSGAQVAGLGGEGSMIAGMAHKCFKQTPNVPVDIVMVADAAGAAKAVYTLTVGGAWTLANTQVPYVAGRRIPVGVGATDTLATVATNICDAINDVDGLPVIATSAGAVVTLTALNAGLEGNNIDVRMNANPGEALAAGMTIAIAKSTAGATNPSLSTALPAIGGIWYTSIAIGWQDSANLSALAAELARRLGAMVKLDAVGFSTLTGTYGQIITAKGALNEKCLCLLGMTSGLTPPWEITGALAGAYQQPQIADPSRQLKDIVLAGVVAPASADRYLWTIQQLLLLAGVATWDVDPSGNVMIQRLVTTYLTNSEGVSDETFQDIMSIATAERVRYDWISYRDSLYPRAKLYADGDPGATVDPSAVTPSRLIASFAARCLVWQNNGWVQDIKDMIAQATAQIDPNTNNRIDALLPIKVSASLMIEADILQVTV